MVGDGLPCPFGACGCGVNISEQNSSQLLVLLDCGYDSMNGWEKSQGTRYITEQGNMYYCSLICEIVLRLNAEAT